MRKVLAALAISIASIGATATVPKAEVVSALMPRYPTNCGRWLTQNAGHTSCGGTGVYYAHVRCVNGWGGVTYRNGNQTRPQGVSSGYCPSGYRSTNVWTYVSSPW